MGCGCSGITVVEIDCNGDKESEVKAFADGSNVLQNNIAKIVNNAIFCGRFFFNFSIFLGMDLLIIKKYQFIKVFRH